MLTTLRRRFRARKYAARPDHYAGHDVFARRMADSIRENFEKTNLTDPADPTHSAVYADWLADHDMPAAERLVRDHVGRGAGGANYYLVGAFHAPADTEGVPNLKAWRVDSGGKIALALVHRVPDHPIQSVVHLAVYHPEAASALADAMAGEGIETREARGVLDYYLGREEPDRLGRRRMGRLLLGDPVAGRHASGEQMFTHPYTDEAGNKLGVARVIPRNDGRTLHLDWVGPENVGPGEAANTTGAEGVRSLLPQLKQHYPGAEFLTGIRAGGVNKAAPKRVVVPMRKARKPSDYAATATTLGNRTDRGGDPAVFADYLQENGLPGAGIARNHTDDFGRNRSGTFGFVRRVDLGGLPPGWSDAYGKDDGSAWVNHEDGSRTGVSISRYKNHHDPAAKNEYYLSVMHPGAHTANGKYVLPLHDARITSVQGLRDLMYDFPQDLQDQFAAAAAREGIQDQDTSPPPGPDSVDHNQAKLRRRFAKVDGHVPAHPLVAGFPIEHALRHLANDVNLPDHVRDTAKTVLTGGPDRDGGMIPTGLWALGDGLEEINHPLARHESGGYNWRSAGDKVELDKHVGTALEELAAQHRARHPSHPHVHPDGHPHAGKPVWNFSAESQATQAEIGLRADQYPEHAESTRYVRERVKQLHPTATDAHIDESIRRHSHRAQHEWNVRAGNKTSVSQYEEFGRKPYIKPWKGKPVGYKLNELASRYARVREFRNRFRRRFAKPFEGKPVKVAGFEPEADFFPEERADLLGAKAATQKTYTDQARKGLQDKPGILPGLSEVKALATAGEPARGGYRETYRTILDILKDPAQADRFVTTNAILSAQTGWEAHTAGAVEALAAHRLGQRKKLSLDQVFGFTDRSGRFVRGTFKGPDTYTPAKAEALKRLFAQGDDVEGVRWGDISKGSYKTPNFGLAFVDPRGTPIDTHMGKLLVPGDGFNLKMMHRIGSEAGVPSEVLTAAKLVRDKVVGKTATHLAYKTLLAKAAKDLGWEPREVQEAVWTATVAAMLSKYLGAGPKAADILGKLNRRAVQAGWSLNSVLTNPEVVRDLEILGSNSRKIAAAIRASEKRTPAGPGRLGTGDPAAFESAVARLPAERVKAAGPIAARLARRVIRMARPDAANYAGIIEGIRQDTTDATGHLALADWLAENGVPGETMARHHADRLQSGKSISTSRPPGYVFASSLTPLTQRATAATRKPLTKPGRGGVATSVRGGGLAFGSATPEMREVPVAQWSVAPGKVSLVVGHRSDESGGLRDGLVTHFAEVHTLDEVSRLTADWPSWARARVYRDAAPHIPRDFPPPTDRPPGTPRRPARPIPAAEAARMSRLGRLRVEWRKKMARPDEGRIQELVRQAAANLGDANLHAVYADAIQDAGLPGAEVIRANASHIQETGSRGSPHQHAGEGLSPGPLYVAGPNPAFSMIREPTLAEARRLRLTGPTRNHTVIHDENGVRQSPDAEREQRDWHLSHAEGRDAGMVQPLKGRLSPGIYLAVSHAVDNTKSIWERGNSANHWAHAPDMEAFDRLTADFPAWLRKSLIKWAGTKLKPRKPRTPPGGGTPTPTPAPPAEPPATYRRRTGGTSVQYAHLPARGDFIDALRRVRSRNMQALHTAARDISRTLGMDPTDVRNALHDGPDGATPGLAQAVYGPAGPETLHRAAALYALLGNQPGAAVFHARVGGPDALYRFRHEGSGLDLRHKLDRAGIPHRVLMPHDKGFDVLVPDPGGRMGPLVRQFAQQNRVLLQASPGHFHHVGDPDLKAAREQFRGIIRNRRRYAAEFKPTKPPGLSAARQVDWKPGLAPPVRPRPPVPRPWDLGSRVSRVPVSALASDRPATPETRAPRERARVWASAQADRHADRVSKLLGVDRDRAVRILSHVLTRVADRAVLGGGMAAASIPGAGGKDLRIGVKWKGRFGRVFMLMRRKPCR